MHGVPVERSGTFLYLCTVKCNHKEYTTRDAITMVYRNLLRKLRNYELSDNNAWELDSDNRWHYHFIIALRREPFFKRFQVHGWTIHFQSFQLADYFNVVNYLKKINQHPAHLDNLDVVSQTYNNVLSFVD